MKQWRSVFFFSVFVLLAAALVGRLMFLQIINHKFYQSQLLGQQMGFQEVTGNRGEIYLEDSKDSHGGTVTGQAESLAINEDHWTLSVVPKLVKDKSAFATSLQTALALPAKDILALLAKSDSYVILQKELTATQVDTIKKLNLDGITFEQVSDRYYPQQQLAANVVGFVGGDGTGQYGLEGYYNDILKGKEGIKQQSKGLDALNPQDVSYLNGADLYLTLDSNIQFQAEQLLARAQKDIRIESGQIIVIKPDSGRILALANFPSFDPNTYSKEADLGLFQDSTTQKLFEPGSVFKPFTMAMGLNEGTITPSTVFNDTGSVTIGHDTVYNFDHEKYGTSDMSRVLEKSINTGAVFVEQTLSHQNFLDYIDQFGFTYKTDVDLQGEVYSRNELLRNGSDFGFATASFGQGIEMTPMQLVRAFCALANGGRLVKPFVVDKIVEGQKVQVTKPDLSDPIVSPQVVSEVRTMLINVVERGFGDGAKIPGYYLAGKTGTAQVPLKNSKGYDPDKTIQSFIGFGPALNPQFLILVKLDNPKVAKSALSAVPVFKKLSQYIINYWQIPPDYTK